MTRDGRGFDPDELHGGESPEPTDGELGKAWAMGRELEALRAADRAKDPAGPGAGATGARGADPAFISRVMAAIEREPSPRPAAAGGRAARQLRVAGVLASFRDAWRVAFGPGRGFAARAGALAYVLVAFVVLGSATGIAVVGTAALLGPNTSQTPQPSAPAVAPNGTPVAPPQTTGPAQSSQPAPSAEPAPSSEPQETEQPDESHDPDDSDETPVPGATPGPGPTASRSPSATPTGSPESTKTPEPSTSPSASPSGTPRPTSSSSGGGD